MTNRDKGVAIGAAVGALAGNVLANNRTTGTLIGGAIGAGVGGLIGYDLDKQAEELRGSLDGRIQIINKGDRLIVSMPQDITFRTDSSAVAGDIQDDLRAVAQSLVKYSQSTVQVIGHTDNVGSSTYNLGLSQQRAQAVVSLLAAYGAPSGRLQTIARGEEQPIASNLTDQGRAANRRVEIVIVPNKT
jgi:outer membrane protein OmpA-like peptidoglycan-associated protein